jgi:hypothetical protein
MQNTVLEPLKVLWSEQGDYIVYLLSTTSDQHTPKLSNFKQQLL